MIYERAGTTTKAKLISALSKKEESKEGADIIKEWECDVIIVLKYKDRNIFINSSDPTISISLVDL